VRSAVLLLVASCASGSHPPPPPTLAPAKEERPAPTYEQALDRGDLGGPLDSGEIAKAMTAAQPRAHACAKKFRAHGSLTVSVTINPTGNVVRALPTGKLAGTPAGDCVIDVVRSVQFRRFDGGPVTSQHTFELR